MTMTMDELLELWERLQNIDLNEDDEIEEDFEHFFAGTNIETIHDWFSEQNEFFNCEDLM